MFLVVHPGQLSSFILLTGGSPGSTMGQMKEQYNPGQIVKAKPIKIRRTWGILRPVTKVKQSKKIYKRDKKVSSE